MRKWRVQKQWNCFSRDLYIVSKKIYQSRIDIKTAIDIAFYVLRIHLSHWTIFGNSPWFSYQSYLDRCREVLGQMISANILSDKLESRQSAPHFDLLLCIICECNSNGKHSDRAANFEPNQSVVNSCACPRYGNTRNNISESCN